MNWEEQVEKIEEELHGCQRRVDTLRQSMVMSDSAPQGSLRLLTRLQKVVGKAIDVAGDVWIALEEEDDDA